MKFFHALILVSLVVPSMAIALDSPKESCSGIQWSPDFLKEYPKAPAACREITVNNGVKYAKFNGKVSKTGSTLVQVEISDVADIPISTIAFQVGVGGRVTVDGREESVKDLKVGDVLTFWVREGQFGVSPTLTDRPMTIVKPDAMTN
jgi:hypothetical protein